MNRISVQVKTHLYPEEVERLDKVVGDYNFKSRYQLIQTIVKSFLKVAYPEVNEVFCIDIENMFKGIAPIRESKRKKSKR